MNEKLKKKYPGLKTKEDYNKLSKMLTYRKCSFCCGVSGISLACIFALLYAYMQLPLFCILILPAVLATLVLDTVFKNKIDESFIAKSMIPPVVEQNTLNLATVLQKIQTKRVAKKKDSNSIFVGWSIFILAIAVYNYFKDSDYNWVNPVLYLVIIPTTLKLLFGILSNVLHDKKIKRITNGEYKVLKTKLAYKTITEIGGDTTSEYYYLNFDCKEYGEFSYKVPYNSYLCSNEREDEYYLLIIPHKRKYKLVEIFLAKVWRCSDELKDIIEIDIDAKVVLGENPRQIDILAVDMFDGDMQNTLKYIAEEEPPKTEIYLKEMTKYETRMCYKYFGQGHRKTYQKQVTKNRKYKKQNRL